MAPSSLLLSVGSLIASSLVTATALQPRDQPQSYQLVESWQGQDFINGWDFFSRPDPTNGFVTYVNQTAAQSSGLVKVTPSGGFYMGVDYESKLSPNGPGRQSVRIESKKFYTEGVYVVDIAHMPGSICGTWPAFWSVGANWPHDGEIDIIEAVNMQKANKIVLHTSGSCNVSGNNDMTGTLSSGECGEPSGTVGCVVKGTDGSSGTPFNEQGGGVYAMEWTDAFLKIWFFPRNSIPASITAGHPDTASFGTPMAHLQGSCDFAARFKAQKFILDTTFCGDWAGNVFGESGCPMSDPSNPIQSCVNYVAQNPAVFKEAYWEINSIKVYQLGNSRASPAASHTVPLVVKSSLASAQADDTPAATAVTVVSHTTTAAKETPVPPQAIPPAAESAPAANSAPSASSAADDCNSKSESEVTVFSTIRITSTTTICPITHSPSAAASLCSCSNRDDSSQTTPAEVVATSIPAAAIPAEDSAASAVTPTATTRTSTVTETKTSRSELTVSAPPGITTTVPAPVPSQVASETTSPDVPDVPESEVEEQNPVPSTVAPSAIPTPAGAFASGSSTGVNSFTSSRRVSESTGATVSASITASTTGSHSDSPTLTAPSGFYFTAGASRLAVGVPGLFGALALAALA